MAFGITQIVPGVSGGTVAIILGFYDRLINSINNFRKETKKSLRFLIPLALGIVLGVLMFGSLVSYLLAHFSFPTMLFFIGLIAGIIPLIFEKVRTKGKRLTYRDVLLVVVPAVLLMVISYIKPDGTADPAEMLASVNLPMMFLIFLAGVIAAAALITPGVSGSFVLLMFGIYPLITYTIAQIGPWLAEPSNTALLLDILRVGVPLGVGIIIGGLATARLIGHLLENHQHKVYSIILGLLVGSVYALFNEPMVYQSQMSGWLIAVGVVMLGLGGLISFMLGRKKL